MPIVEAFNDVKRKPLLPPEGIAGMDDLRSLAAIEIGTGARAFKADQSGIWLGANTFATAPFSVSMLGALAAKSATFKDGDDITIVDAGGLVSTASFTKSDTTTGSLIQAITTGSRTDITGATLTFSLDRAAIVLMIADVRFWMYRTSGSGDWRGDGVMNFDIDGTEKNGAIRSRGGESTTGDGYGSGSMTPGSMHRIEELASGSHTIKLQAYLSSTINNGALKIYNFKLSYIVMGK